MNGCRAKQRANQTAGQADAKKQGQAKLELVVQMSTKHFSLSTYHLI